MEETARGMEESMGKLRRLNEGLDGENRNLTRRVEVMMEGEGGRGGANKNKKIVRELQEELKVAKRSVEDHRGIVGMMDQEKVAREKEVELELERARVEALAQAQAQAEAEAREKLSEAREKLRGVEEERDELRRAMEKYEGKEEVDRTLREAEGKGRTKEIERLRGEVIRLTEREGEMKREMEEKDSSSKTRRKSESESAHREISTVNARVAKLEGELGEVRRLKETKGMLSQRLERKLQEVMGENLALESKLDEVRGEMDEVLRAKQVEFASVLAQVATLQSTHATVVDVRDLKIAQLEESSLLLDASNTRLKVENTELTSRKQEQIAELVTSVNEFDGVLDLVKERATEEKVGLVAVNASLRVEMDERVGALRDQQVSERSEPAYDTLQNAHTLHHTLRCTHHTLVARFARGYIL